MLRKFIFVFFVVNFATILVSKALVGCYISSQNRILTTPTGSVIFGYDEYTSANVPTNAPNCPRASVGGAHPNGNCGSLSPFQTGIAVNYTILNPPVQCPIDRYVWVLIFGIALLSYGSIRKRFLAVNAS